MANQKAGIEEKLGLGGEQKAGEQNGGEKKDGEQKPEEKKEGEQKPGENGNPQPEQ